MTNYIINAAPLHTSLGTNDLSNRELPRERESIPQHLPKFYIYAQKGDDKPHLVSGNERLRMFGKRTFDERDIYANHATVFANKIDAKSNACVLQRLIPDDAGPKANMTLWLDVLATNVDLYSRNTDGSIQTDALGEPVVSGTETGYKVKWTVTNSTLPEDIEKIGSQTMKVGSQTNPDTGEQSEAYPIKELVVSDVGSDGNNRGFRMWAPTAITANMPETLMDDQRIYPYLFSMIRRDSENSSSTVIDTKFSERELMFTFKKNVVDPVTDQQINISDILLQSYQSIGEPGYPDQYGDFSELYVYNENIEALLKLFHTAEIPYITEDSDFSDDVEDFHLFNFVSGVSSSNIPYHTFQLVDDSDSVRFTTHTDVFSKGGVDGTMNNELFAQLVSREVQKYSDPTSELQDAVVHVEKIMYDSGFPLETKKDLANFISLRKDTFVVLGTHVVGEPALTASQEHSVALSLRTRLQMFPESNYFGTQTTRGMIVGPSGISKSSKYQERLPLTLEIALKSAEYMGSSSGSWTPTKDFDAAPNNILTDMSQINTNWLSSTARNRNWDAGLNWVQSYDRDSKMFPALKTVYSDDTSVLTSYFTVMAIAEVHRVAYRAWLEHTGITDVTDAQLVEKIDQYIIDETQGRFDGKFIIEPETYISDMDKKRGFSWSTVIKVYAGNMRTVMQTHVESRRFEDLLGG